MNSPLATTSFAYKADAIISGCEMAPDNSLEYFFNKPAARDMMLFSQQHEVQHSTGFVHDLIYTPAHTKAVINCVTPKITK